MPFRVGPRCWGQSEVAALSNAGVPNITQRRNLKPAKVTAAGAEKEKAPRALPRRDEIARG
jgi:hypothetical protein